MVLAFLIGWSPLTLFNIMGDYQLTPSFIETHSYVFFLTAHCMAMATVVANPLLFFWLTTSRARQSNAEPGANVSGVRGFLRRFWALLRCLLVPWVGDGESRLAGRQLRSNTGTFVHDSEMTYDSEYQSSLRWNFFDNNLSLKHVK